MRITQDLNADYKGNTSRPTFISWLIGKLIGICEELVRNCEKLMRQLIGICKELVRNCEKLMRQLIGISQDVVRK